MNILLIEFYNYTLSSYVSLTQLSTKGFGFIKYTDMLPEIVCTRLKHRKLYAL